MPKKGKRGYNWAVEKRQKRKKKKAQENQSVDRGTLREQARTVKSRVNYPPDGQTQQQSPEPCDAQQLLPLHQSTLANLPCPASEEDQNGEAGHVAAGSAGKMVVSAVTRGSDKSLPQSRSTSGGSCSPAPLQRTSLGSCSPAPLLPSLSPTIVLFKKEDGTVTESAGDVLPEEGGETLLTVRSPSLVRGDAGDRGLLTHDVKKILDRFLPAPWITQADDRRISCLRGPIQDNMAVQVCVTTSHEHVRCFVHNRALPEDHELQSTAEDVLIPDSVHRSANNLVKLVNRVVNYQVCPGVQQYREFWKQIRDGYEEENLFVKDENYDRTFRFSNCRLLVKRSMYTGVCEACKKGAGRLCKYKSKFMSTTTSPSFVSKFAPNKTLSSEQSKRKLENLQRINRLQQKKILRLRSKVDHILHREAIHFEGKLGKG